ncbi:MAG TPA: sulfite exporter TauE/SafE family protein, partial [Candidatus Nanoarchaeia archaeon]|nr:sulfite exporter TauE/SafE family protein [Candidatus Nanoarchaeia archaeon]
MKTLTCNVLGMTCASCEVLIERKIRQLPGVERVKASKAKNQIEVKCSDEVSLEQLEDVIKDKGYTLNLAEDSSKTKLVINDKSRWKEIGSVLVIMIGAYILLSQLEILPKNLGVTENMSYGFVFLIGLVAATSTCLAVAGGLLLAVVNKYNQLNPKLSGSQKFKPHLYFNAGRILSYTVLGGTIGALGSILTLSQNITGVITIIASILMIIIGLQLLNIFPWLNKVELKMPKFIAHRIYGASEQKEFKKRNAFLFGAATFFLPCGFTQALQLYVLGTGSFLTGALTMLAFSLGTLPALVSLGAFTSFTKGSAQKYFTIFSALLVISLGFFNLTPGFNLVGATIGLSADNSELVDDSQFNIVDGKQIIRLKVDGLDYYPNQFTLKKDVPVEWQIDGSNAVGCAQIISVPKLGILEQLPRGIKTLTFTPTETGKITFTCGMGMAGP